MASQPRSADPKPPNGKAPSGEGKSVPGERVAGPGDSGPAPSERIARTGDGGAAPSGSQTSILARGPWPLQRVRASWREEHYAPSAAESTAADAAIEDLRRRGSPSHDGVAARLLGYSEDGDGGIALELQPQRWALRLLAGDASQSVAALCVTRAADGRWLAGRRASWVASWAGRWALGAGGAVDLDENPADTLVRELAEEWSVTPERVRGEALVQLPHGLVMFVGQAWLAAGAEAEVKPDAEHDEFAWWPAEIEAWPDEAEAPLRRMARWLTAE